MRRLPFPLDAVDEVGFRFERWLKEAGSDDDHVLALWTYCYVRRYFLVRFARDPSYTVAELEEVIELAYRRIEERKRLIDQPVRYARWVIVLCRNTFLNFVNRRRATVHVDRIAEPVDTAEDMEFAHERAGLMEALDAAIGRLPPFLQPIIRMRLREGLDAAQIAARTGRDVATIRAYVHRALARLRADRPLGRWLRDS